MRILLIRTSPKGIVSVPPLGIMYLASTLREWGGYKEVKIIDYAYEYPKIDFLLTDFKPDIVGLSSLTTESPLMHKLAAKIKEVKNDCKVVCGGPHISALRGKILEDDNIDFIVIGEGEKTFVELVRSIEEEKEGWKKISGFGWREDEKIIVNESRIFIENLDEIPFPAWDLIEIEKYSTPANMLGSLVGKIYAPIFTSRGCPYGCIYCHNIFGKKIRKRSVKNIIEEVKFLHDKFGVSELHIFDDIFNIDKERSLEICRQIKNFSFHLAFPNGVRGDLMDEELIHAFKDAGAYNLTYAIETGSERLQKLIKKHLDLRKVKEVIKMTANEGILTAGFFMLGFPTETEEEMLETIDYACSSALHSASFFTVKPFPNTKLFEWAIKEGWMSEISDANYYFYDNFQSNCSKVSIERFRELFTYARRRFKFDIQRMAQILNLVPVEIFLQDLLKEIWYEGVDRLDQILEFPKSGREDNFSVYI